jgi:hypothetical protein
LETSVTLTIPTVDLLGCIGDALPFIDPDKDVTERRCVHLRWDGALFHVSATDGIRAAISSWSPDDTPDEDVQYEIGTTLGEDGDATWEFLLTADDASHLLKTAKPSKGHEYAPLYVTFDGPLLKVRRDREAQVPGFTLTYEGLDHTFPDLRGYVVEAAGKAEPVKEIAWNAVYMADFGKVRQRGGAARWTFSGDRSPAVVEIGVRFVGALMPVRPAEGKAAA